MSRSINNETGVVSESPLIGIDLTNLGLSSEVLRLVEDPFLSHINIRGKADNPEFMRATTEVLGVALPTQANTALITARMTVIWYGPSEWLVLTATDHGAELCTALREALNDTHALVCDVSGGNTVIDISGSKARDLLKKATTIDVHPTAFKTGDSALTTFAHAGAALYQYDDAPGFRIIIRRSFANYLGTWLLDAAREFQG